MTPELENAFKQLVAAVGGPDPLPAGGAAGIVSLAMGTALGMKVLRMSGVGDAEAELEQLLAHIVPQFRADCAAFEALLQGFKLSRDDTARADVIRSAWHEATAAPVAVAVLAARVEMRLESCRERVKQRIRADLSAALDLVRAGRRIASINARENAEHLEPEVAQRMLEDLGSDKQGHSS